MHPNAIRKSATLGQAFKGHMNSTQNFQYCYMNGWRICLGMPPENFIQFRTHTL